MVNCLQDESVPRTKGIGQMTYLRNERFGTKLPRDIVEIVESEGYRIGYADRNTTAWWNDRRLRGELRQFGGYFFWHVREPEETFGGFKTASACYRAAYEVVRALQAARARQGADRMEGRMRMNAG